MKAAVGDRIRVPGRHVGDTNRSGQVVEVRGSAADPAYVVRWDDGHEGVCFLAAETHVEQQARH